MNIIDIHNVDSISLDRVPYTSVARVSRIEVQLVIRQIGELFRIGEVVSVLSAEEIEPYLVNGQLHAVGYGTRYVLTG